MRSSSPILVRPRASLGSFASSSASRGLCRAVFVAALMAASLASGACRRDNEVRVESKPGLSGTQITILGRTVDLPDGPLVKERVPETATPFDGEKVFLLRAPSGEGQAVYFVGDATFVSPPIARDAARPKPLDGALGDLFEAAGKRREELVRAVEKSLGPSGVAKMLAASAHVDDKAWDDAFAKLAPEGMAEVGRGLEGTFKPGAPSTGLKRAVVAVELRNVAGGAKTLAARARDLAGRGEAPRANGVLVRAVATLDKAEGGALGCEVLKKGGASDADPAARDVIVEAALVAIANAGTDCGDVGLVVKALGTDYCRAFFRCSASGPVSPRDASKQDEPPCTKEALAVALAKELERKPADVVASANGTRGPLFAYAALLGQGKVPEAFATAQARRQYAITQPEEPACTSPDLAPGTLCHCDEALIRDQTCRRSTTDDVHVNTCKFTVDDKTKRITNVASVLPQ